jgi:sugar O-acyltransferase (sialic acid O-acetyltransferase NeuD family)
MSPRAIIILGAGGHAKVLFEILRLQGRRVLGVTSAESGSKSFCGVPVLGGDEALENINANEVELVNGVGAIGNPDLRKEIFERSKAAGFTFTTSIHPSAVIASDVEIGEGAQIMAGAVIQPSARIGMNSIINTRAGIDHDCQVGTHAHIAPGATLCGNVTVGDLSLVGAGATVLQGVKIGQRCIIGAGAMLRVDAADGTVLAGVPARLIHIKQR